MTGGTRTDLRLNACFEFSIINWLQAGGIKKAVYQNLILDQGALNYKIRIIASSQEIIENEAHNPQEDLFAKKEVNSLQDCDIEIV